MNIAQALRNSRLEKGIGEKIFCKLLNLSREKLFVERDRLELPRDILKKFKKIGDEVLAGTPLQYCLKSAEFYGREFYVDKNVLIPRPETEILVAKATKFIELRKKQIDIIDIGTGSGCIAVSLFCEVSQSKIKNQTSNTRFFACDISLSVLKIARKNAKIHGAKINFLESDLLDNPRLPKKFDLICANLPYLKSDYLEKLPKKLSADLKNEPALALDGGKDGLDLIKRLIVQLTSRLADNGLAILEIDPNQFDALKEFLKSVRLKFEFKKDLNDRIRYLHITDALLK